MKLKYCSITGADDDIRVEDLSAIGDQYPFVEWAILLLPGSAGLPRFPEPEWIENFARQYRGQHTAMHLCGDALLGFISGQQDIKELMSGYARIQLNLKFGDVAGKYDPRELAERVRNTPDKQFILQYTRDKESILPLFSHIKNYAVLFDESAGRGISPDSWDAPIPGHFCGYAGGLNPDNVGQNLEIISRVVGDGTTWIDMETGVRTNDRFDLGKVRRVLDIAAPYYA